jgi:hypothetical protein
MRYLLCLIPALVGCVWILGCDSDTEVEPTNLAGASGGELLAPIYIPTHALSDSSIYKSAPSEATPAEAAKQAPAISIDDSTAQAVVKTYLDMLEANNLTGWPEIVVPDQRDAVATLADAVGPLTGTVDHLFTAWKSQYPDTPLGVFAMYPVLERVGRHYALSADSVVEMTVTESEASLTPDDGSLTLMLDLRSIDNAWRISDPELPSADQVQANADKLRMYAAANAELEDLVNRIETGGFSSADEARTAIEDWMRNAESVVPVTQAEPEQPAPRAAPADPRPNQPRDRGSDPIDTVPNAGFLNRG